MASTVCSCRHRARVLSELPEDVLGEIALRLRTADQRALALSCWSLHDVTVPILYRSLEFCFHAPSGDDEDDFPNLYRLLRTLTTTTAHAATRHASRCYIAHVITLSYSSYGLAVDRRALPMLASALRFAWKLCHLRIDIASASINTLVQVFQRRSLIRKPFASVIAMHDKQKPAEVLGLPALKSLRCSKIAIAQAMMQHRQINSVVVERLSGVEAIDSLLSGLQASVTSKTSRLSLNVRLLPEEFSPMIKAVLYSFPQLKDLALRCSLPASVTVKFYLVKQPVSAVKLRFLGVNVGSESDVYDTALASAGPQLHAAARGHDELQLVVLGKTLWYRPSYGSAWGRQTDVSLRRWTWLFDRNRGWPLPLLLHLRSPSTYCRSLTTGYGCIPLRLHALKRAYNCLLQIVREMQASSLSPFEEFLLASTPATIDAFFDRWPPNLIFKLCYVSSSMHLAVEAYMARAWEVEKILGRYFPQVSSFLHILDFCGAVVGGGGAYRYFNRDHHTDEPLEIFVPCHGLLRMGNWLKRSGYAYMPLPGDTPMFDTEALAFASTSSEPTPFNSPATMQEGQSNFCPFTFVRPPTGYYLRPLLHGACIRVYAVRDNPVDFLINHFHSTAYLNYLTGKYAISLFPQSTFVRYTTLLCQSPPPNHEHHAEMLSGYRARRLDVISAESGITFADELHTWRRSVSDKISWILPLRRPAPFKSRPPLPLHCNEFEVLPASYGVAPPGAALRVGSRSIYRCVSLPQGIEPEAHQSFGLLAAP
ncbi:hypothetical protein OH77DRAFT_1580423 [Trametes cingulata]|nr:hypothetical protein OH77DRAFT_1580423 [Trametes cingulata]